ncbi:hypothetical protein WMY93_010259 [Mugilogobius chulae]|uniref:Sulfotransferase n=1 Tax=Mugilogobius chulae TaxID=88201 RepID=A0AAW0P6Z2_9GOBI
MGCSAWWTCALNFGHLKAQSKLSVFFTMIIIFMYLFYCLNGYCDSLPRPVFDHQSIHLQNRLEDGRDAEVLGAYNASSLVRGRLQQDTDSKNIQASNISIANNYGSKKFPQAIIIGVKKGGTRALLEFLRIHPDVRAVGAEPHFFDRFYDKGLEWYRNLMPRTLDGQITMEKTPATSSPKKPPSRLLHGPPHQTHRGGSRPGDSRRVRLHPNPHQIPGLPSFQTLAFRNSTTGLIDTSWSAVRIGIYAKHLENWLRYFPLSRFLFVSGERLVTDPAGKWAAFRIFWDSSAW